MATDSLPVVLERAESTPLDRIPADDVAAIVKRVQRVRRTETIVDVAQFGSSI